MKGSVNAKLFHEKAGNRNPRRVLAQMPAAKVEKLCFFIKEKV